MTAFIGLPTKPNKSPVAAIARACGMVEKEDPGNYIWVFQKKTIRIMLEDMRESVKVDRDWCDEVSWIHNWAIAISVSAKRTETDYQNWISLISLLSSSHGATYMHFDEGSGDPTTRWRISDFLNIPVVHSEDGSSSSPKQQQRPVIEPVADEFEEEEQEENKPDVEEAPSSGIQDMIRKELARLGKTPLDNSAGEPRLEPLDDFEDEEEEEEEDEEEESFDGYEDWDFE